MFEFLSFFFIAFGLALLSMVIIIIITKKLLNYLDKRKDKKFAKLLREENDRRIENQNELMRSMEASMKVKKTAFHKCMEGYKQKAKEVGRHFCPYCGTMIDNLTKICSYCGSEQKI